MFAFYGSKGILKAFFDALMDLVFIVDATKTNSHVNLDLQLVDLALHIIQV